MQLTAAHSIDERYLDFVYQPIKGPDGVIDGIFVEGVDVTSRALSEAARRDSEEQLRLATEAAEIGLWDVDVGSDRLFWPPRVKAMFGISPDRAVSMRDDFYPCLHPDDRRRVAEAFAAALDPKRRALYDVEYRTIGKEDGVVRWVAAKGRGVYEGERCIRVIGTAIDITTRKAADAQLQMLNERLEQRVSEILEEKQAAEAHMRQAQKLEALGHLTGGVAHDFNNLLMIIKGGLSLLKRPFIDPERRHKLLSSMEHAADRGANLSRQLLAFARRQPLRAESVDLRHHVEGMRELLDRSLRGDVQVRTEFASDLWPVEVDPAQLELVILNLCVNARDAMPNGGVITIEARNRTAVPQTGTTGEFVALSVVDPGTGIPPEVLEHVFEPFYTTKEVGKGSGLGLPQVHGFAQQSGGSVRIQSKVGEGTRVTLSLPRSKSMPVPVAAPPPPEGARRRGLESMGSILLVEDDNEVAALVTEMLRELGYHITRAASAQAALGALANDREIDIVFSDVMMPGEKNGLDLAAELLRRRPNLKVLLTTGYAGGAISSVNEDVHVLRKPYDIHTLELALRTVLGNTAS
jgi:PAS domain S-box-containing protein